jgi:methyl coenzyme M reductase subunit D
VEGRKNFDNMRSFTGNQYMNNLMRDVETNQKLSYNLLTQNNPAYGFDWRTGNFTRNKKSIMDVQGNAINDRYNDLISIVNSVSDPLEKAKLMVKLEGLRTFGSAQQNPGLMKKGGTKKKNPYTW